MLFQFHKGAIRTEAEKAGATVAPNFNSIKVRLEPGSLIGGLFSSSFQFHKGAIRTYHEKH